MYRAFRRLKHDASIFLGVEKPGTHSFRRSEQDVSPDGEIQVARVPDV
jgi:hypothetical protein